MNAKRKAAIKAIENAVAEFSRLKKGKASWQTLEELHRFLRTASDATAGLWRDADVRPYWDAALESFYRAEERVTPPDFWDDFQKLKARDALALESGIAFLEADPWFFRSGYIKEWLTTFIRRLPLSDAQEERLRRVVLHIVEKSGFLPSGCNCSRYSRQRSTPAVR